MEAKKLKLGTNPRVYPRIISIKIFQIHPLILEISNLEYNAQNQKYMADTRALRRGMAICIFWLVRKVQRISEQSQKWGITQ